MQRHEWDKVEAHEHFIDVRGAELEKKLGRDLTEAEWDKVAHDVTASEINTFIDGLEQERFEAWADSKDGGAMWDDKKGAA